jgi:hypothetical protein
MTPVDEAIIGLFGPAGVMRRRGNRSLKKCPWFGSSPASEGRIAMTPPCGP